MTGQVLQARLGAISDEVRFVAKVENKDTEYIRKKIAESKIVILKNNLRPNVHPVAIGEGVKPKISLTSAISDDSFNLNQQLDIARVSENLGVDVFVETSFNGYIDEIREALLSSFEIPIGSSVLLDSARQVLDEYGDFSKLSRDKILSDIEKHCMDGVDFVKIYPGATKYSLEKLKKTNRIGSVYCPCTKIIEKFIEQTNKENPFYIYFDEILEILLKYDVTIVLSNGLMSDSCLDSLDSICLLEYMIFSDLTKKAIQKGVQVIVEGVSHVTFDKIPYTVKTIKSLTSNVPLYIKGPLVNDCSFGHNDTLSAIGQTYSILSGANFLDTVNPYLNVENVVSSHIKSGVVAAKIAIASANLAFGCEDEILRNDKTVKSKNIFDVETQIENSIDKFAFDGVEFPFEKNSLYNYLNK